MKLRRQDALAAGERRTQRARIAALFARLRTQYRTSKRVLVAVASLFNSLLDEGQVVRPWILDLLDRPLLLAPFEARVLEDAGHVAP